MKASRLVYDRCQHLRLIKNLLQEAAKDANKQRFHYVGADLTNAEESETVVSEVTSWNNGNPPDIVWCCAGNSHPGFFIDTPIKALREQMDTVYWSAAYMAHAVLSKWLAPVSPGNEARTKPHRRHLIFTSSTLAFVPVAGYGPYAPAKAAMRGLSDLLNQEIEMYNGARSRTKSPAPAADVKIHTVFPMGILSPGFENEEKIKPGLTKKLEEADQPQTPDQVARISIKALERGDYLITTMFLGHFMKGSALGSSPRNNAILDTVTSWISGLAMLAVIPDLKRTARKWGAKNGIVAETS